MKKYILFLSVLFIGHFYSCKEDDPAVEEPKQSTLTLQAGLNEETIEFDGIDRIFYVMLPTSFNQEQTYPLVFFFHGLGGNKGFGKSVLEPLVNSEHFIGVSPQGYQNSWHTGGAEVPSTEDDIGFTLKMIELVSEAVNIDTTRIYSMGYSNGGAFSYYLALETDKFAAIASLSASFFVGRTIPDGTKKLSVMQIHGEDDVVVPYYGGESINLNISFIPAKSTIEQWAANNELNTVPITEYPEENMLRYTYKETGNPYEVQLICLQETNHNIGVHRFVSSTDCYLYIWNFFNRFQKQ